MVTKSLYYRVLRTFIKTQTCMETEYQFIVMKWRQIMHTNNISSKGIIEWYNSFLLSGNNNLKIYGGFPGKYNHETFIILMHLTWWMKWFFAILYPHGFVAGGCFSIHVMINRLKFKLIWIDDTRARLVHTNLSESCWHLWSDLVLLWDS